MATEEETIRVIRVLEYVGPRRWVEETLRHNAVGPRGPRFGISTDRWCRELASSEVPMLREERHGD